MKKAFVFVAVLAFGLQNTFGNPANFAEFQQLSSDERRTLVRNENNPIHGDLVRWQWRLQLGEAEWQRRELIRVIARNGYLNLDSLFEYYELIRHEYIKQQLDTLNSEDLSAQNQQQIKRLKSNFDAARDQSSDAIKIAAFLAPSPGVQALDKKADALLRVWAKQCPIGEKWTLSDEGMKSITAAYQAFINSMQKLPTLSNEQIQSTLNSLPKDYPPRGFIY